MKRPLLLATIVLLICVAVCTTSCSHRSASHNKIIVGLLSWPGDGPLYVGAEKGFFRDEGIDLQLQLIESYDSRRAALAGGQIDVDCTTLDQLLIYANSGMNAQVFGLSDFSQGGDGIIATRAITSLQELRGKTVAYAEATPSDFLLRWLLKRAALNPSDIRPRPVADAQAAGTAILAEQVDAAVTYEPWLTQSKNNPNLHILASTKDYPNLIPGLFIARKSDLLARRNLYGAFMRAWFRSVDYFYQNPEPAKEIMARHMGLSRSDLESVLSAIRVLRREDNVKAFDTTSPSNLLQLVDTISQFWKDSGFIKDCPAPESLLFHLY